MIHRLIIPNWRPALLNNMKGHWSNAARLKKLDRKAVWAHSLEQKIPRATGKRRVSLHIVLPKNGKKSDYDAPWKSLLDALVHAGMLIDDAPDYVEQGEITYSRDWYNPCTVIILEDL